MTFEKSSDCIHVKLLFCSSQDTLLPCLRHGSIDRVRTRPKSVLFERIICTSERIPVMNNKQLADTFTLIANLLEIKGEIIYKTLAYRKASESLLALGREASEYWKEGKLEQIPGVGKAIAEKIDELLETGKLGFLEKLRKEIPEELATWLQVPSLGPKKIGMIWKTLGITSLTQLEAAAKEGKLRDLPGMGAKSETAILEGLASLSRRTGRISIGRALPLANEIIAVLKKVKGVEDAQPGGSLRRMRSTIGDLDILVA